MYGQEISASRFVELCLGLVVSENNFTSHTHTILSQNFTNKFFLHTTRSSHATFCCVAVTNRYLPQTSQIADPETNI